MRTLHKDGDPRYAIGPSTRKLLFLWALLFAAAAAASAEGVRNLAPGFTSLPADAKILVTPIDVELYSISAGGVPEPRADWTMAAQANMKKELGRLREKYRGETVQLDERSADDLGELLTLHAAVARSINLHHGVGGMWALPTKEGKLDWSFGDALQPLQQTSGARYALFIWVRDSYASAERVAAMVLMAALGVGLSGGTQQGYASLVDLETGRVLWFNSLARASGDLREPAKAAETVDALLLGFPGIEMNRRGFLRWGCMHCALLYAAARAQQPAVESGSSPAPWPGPPRFALPDAASDEGGLWAMMAREEQRLRRGPFLLRDEGLRGYLQELTCRLAGPHCPDVRVYAVRNAYFNANMAPNGMMQIWSGLLLRMDNEAQLSAVVAHEVGHFLKRHSLERLRDAKSKSAASMLLAPFGLAGLAGQLILIASMFSYSRDQEREADAISVQLMTAAGYDTSQASIVWANLLAEVAARPNADASKTSVLFATHPTSEERRNVLREIGRAGGEKGEQSYRERLASWQLEFLEDELKRGQYEETVALLDRKLASEPRRADYRYARGEARRLRGQDKDAEQAFADLNAAATMDNAPAPTHRSLGLLLRARQDNAAAAASFARYLELAPDAPDAGIIKTYISELQT